MIYSYCQVAEEDKNAEQLRDYQIALMICSTSLLATFMAQQSCIIGIKFAQGDYEPQNYQKMNCFSRLTNILLLTVLGATTTFLVEVIDNVAKIMKLPGLLLGGTRGAERVSDCFAFLKQKLTNLNGYQLKSLEEQRKVNALLFENLPSALLLFSIKIGLLDCPGLAGANATAINISLATTLISVAITVAITNIQSKWLQQSTLSYLMTKMTANNNWIPFVHLIAKRDCKLNINFGDLSIKLPFASHAVGFQ